MKWIPLAIIITTLLFGCDLNNSRRNNPSGKTDSSKISSNEEFPEANETKNHTIDDKSETDLFNTALKELYKEFKYKSQNITENKL